MMKKGSLLLLFLWGCFLTTEAQYFYKDIYKTKRTNQEFQQYKKEQIKEIRIHSFDGQGQPVSDFYFKKRIDTLQQKAVTVSKSSYSPKNTTTAYFDPKGRLTYTVDSTANHTNSTHIFYGSGERIDSIVFINFSAKPYKEGIYNLRMPDTLREKHAFSYQSDGTLRRMSRWKNGRLYKTIYFKTDSLGQVFKEYQKGKTTPLYYYKYQGGLLTDVFHFSYRERKMIPDYLLNYNDNGQLSQKTVVMADKHNYLEWHYAYNQSGLKATQKGYNNKGELQGQLKYKYLRFP